MGTLLHHISVTVEDLDRAVGLFRDVLGFELQWRVPKAGGRVLESLLGVPGIQAELAFLSDGATRVGVELSRLMAPESTDPPRDFGAPGTMALSLSVRDLDALHQRLTRLGWSPLSPCLDLKPPGGPPARAFCVPLEPGVLLELIEEAPSG